MNGIAGHKVGVKESETLYESSFTPSPVRDFQVKQVLFEGDKEYKLRGWGWESRPRDTRRKEKLWGYRRRTLTGAIDIRMQRPRRNKP